MYYVKAYYDIIDDLLIFGISSVIRFIAYLEARRTPDLKLVGSNLTEGKMFLFVGFTCSAFLMAG